MGSLAWHDLEDVEGFQLLSLHPALSWCHPGISEGLKGVVVHRASGQGSW